MAVTISGTPVQWSIDGSFSTTTSPSFSTAASNCLLVLLFASENGNTALPAVTVSGITDTTGQSLVWHKYTANQITTTQGQFGTVVLNAEIWYAQAPSTVTAKTVTVSVTNGTDNDGTFMVLFATVGQDATNPFDLNAVLPKVGQAAGFSSGTVPQVTGVSTTTATGILVSFFASSDSVANTNVSGTFIGGGYDGSNVVGILQLSAYQTYTSAVSGATEFPVSSTQSGYDNWLATYFAITDASQGPGPSALTIFQTDAWQPNFIQEFASSAAPPTVIWGFDAQPVQPSIYSQTSQRQAALSQREDGIEAPFINFRPYGWEIQPPQLQSWLTYNLRTPTAGALSQREDGIEAPYLPPPKAAVWGFEQTYPPPFFRTRTVTPFKGDDGIESQFTLFYPYGWDIQGFQPPHQFYEKKGGILRGDDGNQSPYINFYPYGWEIQPYQVPHQFIEKRGSFLKGDDGTEGQFIKFLPFSFEVQPPQPPFRINQNRGTILKGDEGIQSPYINFKPYGWEIQPPQPPHQFYEKKGGILRGIDGIEENFINFYPFGWEISPFYPPNYPKTGQKTGSWSHPEDGTEATYVFISPFQVIWGFDGPLAYPKKLIKHVDPPLNIDAQYINFKPYGWELQSYQPQHTFIRIPSILRGDDGNQAQFINFLPYGWEIQPPQPPNYPTTRQKTGNWSHLEEGIEAPFIFVSPTPAVWGYDGPLIYPKKLFKWFEPAGNIDAQFINFFPAGWEVQPYQLPHRQPEIKAASFLKGDDGTEGVFINWKNYGWEIQPPQPPNYPKTNQRTGSWSQWEDGIEAPYIFVPFGFTVWAFDPQPVQPPYHINRLQALLRGDDGIEGPFVNWRNFGWEIPPPPPPHTFIEKRGLILRGDDGTEGTFIRFFPYGWEVAPYQPPHRQPENKAATFLRGDEGIQQIVIRFFPGGWAVQPHQPQHPRPERSGAVQVGDQGNQGIYHYVPPPPVTLRPGWLIRARHTGRR